MEPDAENFTPEKVTIKPRGKLSMGFFHNSPRDTADLIRDPEFISRAWRLQGAADMAGHWLMLREDSESQEMGRRLLMVSSWFMQNEPSEWGSVRKEP